MEVSPSSSSTVAPGSSSTVAPSSSSTVAPGTSSMLSEAGDTSNETMAVDDQNMPGYQHVDRLAEYLVGLREQTSLSHQPTSRLHHRTLAEAG
ncbi:hypothetical protein AMECASPLE_029384 [Ameca splendens]|uniref:Uncharacterized protein n=1 Tax=Ameca splendens TaxID=208324 RepID=A0ABV1AC07_9TELE